MRAVEGIRRTVKESTPAKAVSLAILCVKEQGEPYIFQ